MTADFEEATHPARARGELAHAVVDGPGGTQVVKLSLARAEALKWKVQHRGSFWCSTQAGGCGGPLVLAAGPVRIPHFRHHRGADCALAGDSARAARSYEHLQYQRALLAWLGAQGLDGTMEHHLGPDGRADLHVIVATRRHTIEVQLSPIAITEWQRRDEGYRRQVDHVAWLYGPVAEAAAAAERALNGHALHVRVEKQPGTGVEIGVVTELSESWAPLTECLLRQEGFWTPHLENALADVAAARKEATARAAEEDERTALLEAARRRAAESRSRSAAPSSGSAASPVRQGALPWGEGMYPEMADWTPAEGWAWTDGLTEDGRATARVLSYVVSRLYFSGPVSMLLLPDEETGAAIVAALERAGLIRLYERQTVQRWERT